MAFLSRYRVDAYSTLVRGLPGLFLQIENSLIKLAVLSEKSFLN